ncbi:MAG: ABC transporter permease [Saprospirales bacterium]|nr:MAG: ABC transporter permease [Saprospirales bacterium]
MKYYLLRRILLFIPALLVISLLVFGLGQIMPGDPVERLAGQVEDFAGAEQYHRHLEQYRQTRNQMGLNLPVFYFSVLPAAVSPELREIPLERDRERLRSLMLEIGHSEKIIEFFRISLEFSLTTAKSQRPYCPEPNQLNVLLRQLQNTSNTSDLSRLKVLLNEVHVSKECDLKQQFDQLLSSVNGLLEIEKEGGLLRPVLYWNGTQNRYHRWISSALAGDWGRSMRDGQEVGKKIIPALKYTLILSVWSILLTFLIGIPLGMFLAVTEKKQLKRLIRNLLYALYAMPLFWMATMAIVFFTTNEYGSWTNIFPSSTQIMIQTTTGHWFSFGTLSYLLLPVLCMAFSGAAFVARQMEESALREKYKAYLSMSALKGNSNLRTIFKHWFPNAIFPLITLSAAVLPSLISGSVVIEVIFNIPGMGRLLWDSIFAQDWNTLMAILLLGGVLTMFGQLLADIFYKKADPRVKYD